MTMTTTAPLTAPCSRCGHETPTHELLHAEVGAYICPGCHREALASWPAKEANWN